MLSGCALVTADNGGCRDFAMHGQTALICEPNSSEELAKAIHSLIEDDEKRIRIALAGNDQAKSFKWSSAFEMFASHIKSN